jgi:hypothetical protein
VFDLAEGAVLGEAKSAGASGEGDIIHDHAHSLAHTDGRDGEVRAAQPEGWNPDNE